MGLWSDGHVECVLCCLPCRSSTFNTLEVWRSEVNAEHLLRGRMIYDAKCQALIALFAWTVWAYLRCYGLRRESESEVLSHQF